MESGQLSVGGIEELDLDATLRSGQVFRWRRGEDGVWRGAVGGRPMQLAQSDDGATVRFAADGPGAEAAVRSFLRLDDFDLASAAEGWGRRDALFADAWARQPGVRVLRQDPDECFFSFLCASVAPIRRIASMLAAVAEAAGADAGGAPSGFPSAVQIARLSEARLRGLGLGFRAVRVAAAARSLADAPPDALSRLRGAPLEEIRAALTAFDGVGTKIADCIALFALDRDEAVPVDTHIWRIAQNRYAPELAGKSLTPARYALAAAAFRDRFGTHAGWAQQTLFYRAAVGSARGRAGASSARYCAS